MQHLNGINEGRETGAALYKAPEVNRLPEDIDSIVDDLTEPAFVRSSFMGLLAFRELPAFAECEDEALSGERRLHPIWDDPEQVLAWIEAVLLRQSLPRQVEEDARDRATDELLKLHPEYPVVWAKPYCKMVTHRKIADCFRERYRRRKRGQEILFLPLDEMNLVAPTVPADKEELPSVEQLVAWLDQQGLVKDSILIQLQLDGLTRSAIAKEYEVSRTAVSKWLEMTYGLLRKQFGDSA